MQNPKISDRKVSNYVKQGIPMIQNGVVCVGVVEVVELSVKHAAIPALSKPDTTMEEGTIFSHCDGMRSDVGGGLSQTISKPTS